jgi:phosphatidate cytidylyltransferase
VKARVAGSAIVVALGLLPTILGGPIFAILLIALGIGGYHEFLALTSRFGATIAFRANVVGYVTIVGFAILGLVSSAAPASLVLSVFAVLVPMAIFAANVDAPQALTGWSLSTAGSLYLGFPIFAGVALRSLPGPAEHAWALQAFSELALPWDLTPRGMGWALTAVLATWIGDTAAYLAGKSVGERKLAPRISPGKTVEGAAGGLAGSTLIGAVSFAAFGIGPWWLGLLVGAVIGLAGQVGDLCESFLKRQAGVKDSGGLIPGHGGILDRIDALLFAFPTSFALAAGLERLLVR